MVMTERSAAKAGAIMFPARVRHLIIVLGDQLDEDSSALQGLDPAQDLVWMCEAAEESTHVWSAQQRIAVFLSAMRHFAQALQAQELPLAYTRLDDAGNLGTLALEARAVCERHAQCHPLAL